MTQKQRVICITGMPRSGTSTIARIINILGVYLGPKEKLIMETPYNEKGCWEYLDILELNNEILKRFGIIEHSMPEFSAGWENDQRLEDLEVKARKIINDEFGGAALWGWKDVKFCLTLPFWQKIIPELEYVICIRNPMSVAKSVIGQGWTDSFENACYLWLNYTASVVKHTRGRRRIFVFYDDIMSEGPENEMRRIAGFLGGQASEGLDDKVAEASRFVERKLQHHNSTILGNLASQDVPVAVKAAYLILSVLARDETCAVPGITGVSPAEVLNSMFNFAGGEESMMNKMLKLMKKMHELESGFEALLKQKEAGFEALLKQKDLLIADRERRIEELENSFSWKVTAPLRAIRGKVGKPD